MKFEEGVEVKVKKSLGEAGTSLDKVIENPLLRFFRKLQKEDVNEKRFGVSKRR
jgi:hypothetical protein